MPYSAVDQTLDFHSDTYRDAFTRINGIVIEGEQAAYDNFLCLADLLPEQAEELVRLGKMEGRHRKSFEACGRNLDVIPDLAFANQFFADLCQAFQTSATDRKIATCLLIQSLIIECFAIAAYNVYIPVADAFAQKVTKGVVADEYHHLNFGEVWLKAHFETVKAELETANRQVLPLIWQMLNQVEADLQTVGMDKQTLIESFLVHYSEALKEIGFNNREILRMASHGLASSKQR
ncbi:aldehyde oxygenase (deformylating) [Leptolyngbyaceae cyanobacterium CCMR0082]|uniref:Aldehyde decarbonylase n=2 Tax=Adonisia turfae TaxID=2950184 RepID=A0A6M0RZQ3_9CYAN|nr:aldehyde oxygenase (deformylating) [Adonisia turfae]MDV3349280.1 aldehyde oxygenase (deformylating) [Leptothoe sp. LEGE 181152]NEZ59363.1 aldehyde oxygenase (deformylating) [Adonisia turfae CCMR0081]NEZ61440.1 aldehyde oxygenase (deformylating) [Adonisia turfae CCMR0082]